MRFLFLPIFLLFFSIFTQTSLFAEGGTTVTFNVKDRLEQLREKRQEKLEKLADKRQEKIDKLESKRAEIKDKSASREAGIKQRIVEKIKKVFTKILERLQAALERLDNLAVRIATRIDKLNEKGVDTSKAETELAEAESLGAFAAQSIADAQAAVDAIDPQSTSVRDAVGLAKEAVRSAKETLSAYHKALVEALRELKAAAALREEKNE